MIGKGLGVRVERLGIDSKFTNPSSELELDLQQYKMPTE